MIGEIVLVVAVVVTVMWLAEIVMLASSVRGTGRGTQQSWQAPLIVALLWIGWVIFR